MAMNESEAQKALQESQERFRELAENLQIVFWMTSVDQRTLIYINPAYEKVWGRTTKSLYEKPSTWDDALHPEDKERVLQTLSNWNIEDTIQHEYRIVQPNGQIRWIWDRGFPIRNAEGKVYRRGGIAEDITERKLLEQQLAYAAIHDTLTGLPNRTLFLDRLNQVVQHANRFSRHGYAVALVNVDRFKHVNEAFGRTGGDQLLQSLGKVIADCLDPEDTLARIDGNEFAILVAALSDSRAASRIAEQLRQKLTTPFDIHGHEIFLSVSVGIALGAPRYTDPESVLRDATFAMKKAKNIGKGHCIVFDHPMEVHSLKALQLETDMRKALERGSFELYFQPILSMQTGKVVGAESLMRWKHTDRGWISPGIFIPVAEESGLIIPLGEWSIQYAARENKRWLEQGLSPGWLSVNVSAHQFRATNIQELVYKTITELKIDPTHLKLELTESTLMADPKNAAVVLSQLKELGLTLAIDDFGTGYSSLSYLKRFPFDTVKIDRSFVMDLTHDPDAAAIAQAIIGLAHNLEKTVVAEGVETIEQFKLLRDLGCDLMQGYLFSPAVSSENFSKILKEGRCLEIPF